MGDGQPPDRVGDPAEAAVPVLSAVRCHDDVRIAGFDDGGDRPVDEREGREIGADRSASMPVLPVTKIRASSIPSRTRFCLVRRRRREMERGDPRDHLPVQLLGERRQRRPCTQSGLDVADGNAQVEGAWAAAAAEEVSPWTSVAAGNPLLPNLVARGGRLPGRLEPVAAERVEFQDHGAETRSLSVSFGWPTARSASGSISARSRIGRTRSGC